MNETLSGASRVHFIVGDPIAQVKSPAGVTQAFADHGRDAICVPAHVSPAHLADWVRGASLAQNVDGIIVTVPHKFACTDLCATTSDRAAFLHTVNTMRRNADGSWHGDMFDGLGFVTAMQDNGCQPAGKKALLVGAGNPLDLHGLDDIAAHRGGGFLGKGRRGDEGGGGGKADDACGEKILKLHESSPW